MKKYFLLSVIAISVVACSKKTNPTSGSGTTSQYAVMDEKATKGMNLETKYCTSCHKFRVPYNFTKSKWDKVLPTMYKKAKMTDSTQQQLVKYFIYNNLQKPASSK